jgi:hypothetical protein
MATEPLNLIQVQSRLQDPLTITNQDLLKYANGSNPEVPSFLALIEMNRRKQIEDTTAQFQSANVPSVKDQLARSLTSPTMTGSNQMMQVDPTNAPIGIINPTKMSMPVQQTANPMTLPPQVDMTAEPAAPVQAARGGLMSLPTNHFKASSYAGGGIIAFNTGNAVKDEEYRSDPYGAMTQEQRDARRNIDGLTLAQETEQERLVAAAQQIPRYYNPETTNQALAQSGQTLQDEGAAAAVAARNAPPAPSRLEGILAALPKQQDLGVTKPEPLTPEQAFENIKKTQELAGVSADPYAETKKRQEALEARQLAEYERGGIDRLLAQASAFATADPSKGFGYAAAASSTASRALAKEQNALRTQQETAGIEFQKAMAKEEDAKARGNATAIASAVEERKKAEVKYAELIQQSNKIEQDRIQLAVTAEHYQNSDEVNREKNKITEAYNNGQLTLQEAKNQIDALQAKSQASHYANQASYNKGYLKYLNRTQDIAEASKPTAEDKKLATVEARVNSDPTIKALSEALKPINGIDPGSEEYYDALTRIREAAIPYYKSANLPPPPPVQRIAPLPKPVKKGFFDFFSSNDPATVDTRGFKYIGKE